MVIESSSSIPATADEHFIQILPSTERTEKKWNVKSSKTATNTVNPIRRLVDSITAKPNPDKKVITLSLGDPTVFGNFEPPEEAIVAIENAVRSGKYNGYGPSFGFKEAREAVAEFVSAQNSPVTSNDIYLSCGCSDALNMAITVLADAGDNILIPRPGFSIYKTYCQSMGIESRLYNCLPHKSWEIDLDSLSSLVDDKTKAIIIVNPSNPCGSNFSRQHILDIIAAAEKYKIPIIADEIYADMVFKGHTFHSCASLSTNVPVIQCGGMAKRFLLPGWRLGWVVVHDRQDIFGSNVRMGLLNLSQRILGPCTLVQAALPAILKTPKSFHETTMEKLEKNADLIYKKLEKIPGLNPVRPSGAMYMMVGFEAEKFPQIENDLDFCSKLITEQSVVCLPAKCFEMPNYFRLVITVPGNLLDEAGSRISEFCTKYYQ